MPGGRNYTPKSVTITSIAEVVSHNRSMSFTAVESILREAFDHVASSVAAGRRVHVHGLGTFTRRNRVALDIKGGPKGPVKVDARSRAYYSPAKWLRHLPPVEHSPIDDCPFL
jgi:nucleoid DNA-binding protein